MKNVIFDLDLTLLDTLDDLKEAMNYVLRTFGFPERTKTEINSFIGNGIRKLITRSLPTGSSEELIEKGVLLFRTYYKEHMMVYTKPYDGIIDMLMELKQHGFKLGVASNKDDFAVNILCDKYFEGIFDGISGSSDIIKTKPNPDMVLNVLQKMNEKEAIYVGDSEVDAETAQNSGLNAILVSYGSRTREQLEKFGFEIVDSVEELKNLLFSKKSRQL